MILSNTENIPGKTIQEFYGVVTGSTVRAKHIGRDIMAGFGTEADEKRYLRLFLGVESAEGADCGGERGGEGGGEKGRVRKLRKFKGSPAHSNRHRGTSRPSFNFFFGAGCSTAR